MIKATGFLKEMLEKKWTKSAKLLIAAESLSSLYEEPPEEHDLYDRMVHNNIDPKIAIHSVEALFTAINGKDLGFIKEVLSDYVNEHLRLGYDRNEVMTKLRTKIVEFFTMTGSRMTPDKMDKFITMSNTVVKDLIKENTRNGS